MCKWFQPTAWAEAGMVRCGVGPQPRRVVIHYLELLGEQLSAMLPLSLVQVIVLAAFFHKTAEDPGIAAAGLLSAVLGLVLFLDGLRLAIMPMAMQVGHHLPEKLPLFFVLLVAFCLGVLVTYAEPAIAAIRPLASLVDPVAAPYLYYVLNQQQELTVLSIGLGVGLAAVLGMLKFMYNLPLKALIAASLLPTLAAACWMQWGNPHLRPILGVAWDCGAVTTGPVTVPILIALGVSVMKVQRAKQEAFEAVEEAAVNTNKGSTLEGFGIVTLASLLPVFAVELMAIIVSLTHPYEEVLREVSEAAKLASTAIESPVNRSPVREVIFAVRAITPLCVALLFLVVVILRIPLPVSHFDKHLDNEDHHELHEEGDEADVDDSAGRSDSRSPSRLQDPRLQTSSMGGARTAEAKAEMQRRSVDTGSCSDGIGTVVLLKMPNEAAGSKDVNAASPRQHKSNSEGALARDSSTGQVDDTSGTQAVPAPAAAAVQQSNPGCSSVAVCVGNGKDAAITDACSPSHNSDGPPSHTSLVVSGLPAQHTGSSKGRRSWGCGCWSWVCRHKTLLVGMLMCQVGMILFNLGLTYGFTALGDMTGTWLPTSFMKLPYAPGSPYYSLAGGVVLTMATIFALGVLATNAEPALNVLGKTVETLSNGRFTKRLLVWAVSIGVAIGMDVGAAKILFSLPLIYFILGKYAVASALTAITKEGYAAVAWDSAGVTTGPVTVPFVLAIGLAFGNAVGAPEGFGMLTVMSVVPIISVLITSLLRKPVQHATAELVRISTNLATASLQRFSRRSSDVFTAPSVSVHSDSLWRKSTSFWTASEAGAFASGLPRSSVPRANRPLHSVSAPFAWATHATEGSREADRFAIQHARRHGDAVSGCGES